jgi:hypothetical protein
MAKKLRDFTVTLYPATLDRGYIVTRFDFGQDLPKKSLQAATAEQAVAEALAFATTHGKPCQASVRIASGRKPTGFDKQTRALYFNMNLPQAS